MLESNRYLPGPAIAVESQEGVTPIASALRFELCNMRGGANAQSSGRGRPAPAALLSSVDFPVDASLKVVQVHGDGRCMFRALAKGFARNAGYHLTGETETSSADELRNAVSDALCRTSDRRETFSDALPGVQAEGGLNKYCQKLQSEKFWGGEVELLILSKMVSTPIYIYRTAQEAGLSSKHQQGFVTMVSYGEQYEASGRKPVRLLYRGGNHYDLLLD